MDIQIPIGSQGADPPLLPTPDFLAELKSISTGFENAEPEDILSWAYQRFESRFTMATAFGPEGMVILEMLSRVAPQAHVLISTPDTNSPKHLRSEIVLPNSMGSKLN